LVAGSDPDRRMPPEGDPLTKEQVETIRRWIDQGAVWDAPSEYHLPLRPVALPPGPGNPIDRLLVDYYQQIGSTPRAVIRDEQYVRRVTFDLVGFPPTEEELSTFLRDTTPDKRRAWAENLLGDADRYANHWMTFWSDHLRIGSEITAGAFDGDNTGAPREWLLSGLKDSVPYDALARELIAGDLYEKYALCVAPPEDIISPVERAEMQIGTTISQVFLGIQMKCASCHDSFIDRWTLQDAWGLAAALGGQELPMQRCQIPTGETAKPKFPLAELGEVDPALDLQQKRRRVAELMTCAENGLFARTVVNRLWARLLGRGMIEPLDEMMEHEPWYPPLMDWLAGEFVRSGYDLKHMLVLITSSEAYQRPPQVRAEPLRADSPYQFQGPELRWLTAEQFVDTVTRLAPPAPPVDGADQPAAKRAWQRTRTDLMTVLGRPTRDVVVSARVQEASALLALEMMNGQELQDLVQRGASTHWNPTSQPSDVAIRIYRELLSRNPTAEERLALQQVAGQPFTAEGTADMLWAVLMLPEFQLLP